MPSIFGDLDKRHRAAPRDADLSFEDRADLFNDLLEDDATTFPLLACPSEVLAAVLLMSMVSCAVRLRPVCSAMRGVIDGNVGFWCSVLLRDFADLGGMTKHYHGLRMNADTREISQAVPRLEWDPLMICAPPALRYMLLAAGEARRRLWNDCGRTLGAGWAWFSTKVCRRMATSTFLRWASLQYDGAALGVLLGPLSKPAAAEHDDSGDHSPGTQQFRCGRSDAVTLSAEAVTDIYETVRRWHSKAHCEMMRAHIKGPEQKAPVDGGGDGGPSDASCLSFSVTPTLDAAEAAAFASAEAASLVSADAPQGAEGAGAGAVRGAASRRIEEAQLKLALEISKAEAEAAAEPAGASAPAAAPGHTAAPTSAGADQAGGEAPGKPEPAGLPLHAEGPAHAAAVFLKENCVAERVDELPDALEKSVEHIVNKMAAPASWGLLYESLTEELSFRAKSAAHALCTSNLQAIDGLRDGDASLKQERMCLPIWKSSTKLMTGLSGLRAGACDPDLRRARWDLLRQASLEWRELEDLTEFLDSQLAPLELAIDNFRAMNEAASSSHTPHVRDIGRLMFRNCCLLDSRVFKPLCLASYSLVHDIAAGGGDARRGTGRDGLLEVLEGLHAMLVACDVADDHLSASKSTKDAFVEHLVEPISAALERLADWEPREPRRQEPRRPGADSRI